MLVEVPSSRYALPVPLKSGVLRSHPVRRLSASILKRRFPAVQPDVSSVALCSADPVGLGAQSRVIGTSKPMDIGAVLAASNGGSRIGLPARPGVMPGLLMSHALLPVPDHESQAAQDGRRCRAAVLESTWVEGVADGEPVACLQDRPGRVGRPFQHIRYGGTGPKPCRARNPCARAGRTLRSRTTPARVTWLQVIMQ